MTGTTSRRCPNQPPQAAGKGADSKNKRMVRRAPTTVLDQRFNADNLSALRSAVIAQAAALVNDDTAEEMVVVSHELATNVVRHGGGRGRFRLWSTDDRLWCEVSDYGPGFHDPAFAGTTLPAPNTSGGRGLWIARQMSDLTITTTAAGTTITAAIPRR
jgi:anti-sigma regulatory factor (Ser/Thr protein kinase)